MVKYYRQTMALPPEQDKRVFYVLIDLPLYAVNQLKAEVGDAFTKADGVSPTVH